MWESRFGGRMDAIGEKILLDGDAHTIIGVMPPEFSFPQRRAQIWRPLRFAPADLANRNNNYLSAIARRKRKETPSKYEAYVDLVPGAWTKIKVEVRGEQARLYVHDNEQPTLIVKDVRSGANGHGGVALWLEPGTVAHFRNLTLEPLTR